MPFSLVPRNRVDVSLVGAAFFRIAGVHSSRSPASASTLVCTYRCNYVNALMEVSPRRSGTVHVL